MDSDAESSQDDVVSQVRGADMRASDNMGNEIQDAMPAAQREEYARFVDTMDDLLKTFLVAGVAIDDSNAAKFNDTGRVRRLPGFTEESFIVYRTFPQITSFEVVTHRRIMPVVGSDNEGFGVGFFAGQQDGWLSVPTQFDRIAVTDDGWETGVVSCRMEEEVEAQTLKIVLMEGPLEAQIGEVMLMFEDLSGAAPVPQMAENPTVLREAAEPIQVGTTIRVEDKGESKSSSDASQESYPCDEDGDMGN